MKQVLFLVILLNAMLTACKPKENTNTTNPSAVPSENKAIPALSAMDKLPNTGTGWTIAPCHLVEEEDIRQQLKVNTSIAMVPEAAVGTQSISICTFRWMKSDFAKIDAENKKNKDAIAKKGGGVATLKPVVDLVSVSYTSKYNDAAAANTAIKEMIAKDKLKNIANIGDAAAWNSAANQLVIQKGNAIFYLVVEMDAKKNLEYAQGLAASACKRI
jgi:hypothetical protein